MESIYLRVKDDDGQELLIDKRKIISVYSDGGDYTTLVIQEHGEPVRIRAKFYEIERELIK